MTSRAEVHLWGAPVGVVRLEEGATTAVFRYDPSFVSGHLEVSPLAMTRRSGAYSFPELAYPSFRGLPGLLADSLPDRYGHALIDTWLAVKGWPPEHYDAVARLCYVGSRGMGALEYAPGAGPQAPAGALDIGALVAMARNVLAAPGALASSLAERHAEAALKPILSVGTSAGGSRAKAVITWNPATGEARPGDGEADQGFEHWLLKLDVHGATRHHSHGPGVAEYAYALMAKAAGIDVPECRLLEEGARRHFMVRRFDRPSGGQRLHMQSLGGLAHYDFNRAGAYGYEEAMALTRRLGLSGAAVEEQFRRMIFNVMARNQDDHVKNIAFLMDRSGQWTLSPAFDLTYAYSPKGRWTSRHQMSINGKRDHFAIEDLRACAATASIGPRRCDELLEEVRQALSRWRDFAEEAGVSEQVTEFIGANHRLEF